MSVRKLYGFYPDSPFKVPLKYEDISSLLHIHDNEGTWFLTPSRQYMFDTILPSR